MEEGSSGRSSAQQPGCFGRIFSALTVDDVYEIAKLIGAEVEKLIDGYGKESVEGLVTKVVKVLELLESFASRNHALSLREEELLRTFETIQRQQQRRRGVRDCEEGCEKHDIRELQQKEQQWKRRCEELQVQVQQLHEDREELQNRLKGNYAQEGILLTSSQKHSGFNRGHSFCHVEASHLMSKDSKQQLKVRLTAEAYCSPADRLLPEHLCVFLQLQEQLDRFMKMNGELRHKQSVLQAQLTSAVERKADMEADLKEKTKETERLRAQLSEPVTNSPSSPSKAAEESSREPTESQLDLDQPCFTKKEVRDILFERNELKTNLFLVQEELNYYQREILNEERCPGFLLEAVRSAIKTKRRLIKAKMLGIPASECNSSDDEDRCSRFGQTEVDGAAVDEVDRPAESRIRNLFGFLTRSGSGSAPTSNSASSWEVIGDTEASEDVEQQLSS
ncbi:RILP-like protein 1 [Austrofundulus limnaeus]|uniref:RILP-like protein 2 n=1 Tax=Austrofundulus limnaeus TaxID=52670 RepID=A0A2I4AYT9_AUSLI|nr:PREDICTED: rab-interacting lysosomal protein [Austrofundulus limnaeus]